MIMNGWLIEIEFRSSLGLEIILATESRSKAIVSPKSTNRQDILRDVGHVINVLQDKFFILTVLILQTQSDCANAFDWYLGTISNLDVVARIPGMYEIEK